MGGLVDYAKGTTSTDEALPHRRIVEANAVMIPIVRFGNGEIHAKTRAKDLVNVPQAGIELGPQRILLWGKETVERRTNWL